ncbi:MAG: sugar porter family MFS transporter [Actinomycetota bacterium]|nr:sugar porter family MFS transporter [Actinomycetota bacterium]
MLLDPDVISQFYCWRIAFFLGGILGIAILLIRRHVPESPRWLATHGRNDEAERIVGEIENDVKRQTGRDELRRSPTVITKNNIKQAEWNFVCDILLQGVLGRGVAWSIGISVGAG